MNVVIRASIAGNGTLSRRIVAGGAFAFALSASSGAFAACTGTGSLVGLGAQVLPFSAGGAAVNSLVSAINATNTVFLTQSTAFVSAPPNPAPGQEGGGVWVRGIGGELNTKNTTTTSNVSVGGVTNPGQIDCNNSSQLNFAGMQIGADAARLNWNGWNVHLGTTIGYLGARSRDTSSAGPENPMGGTFQNSLQVPFVGVYAAATRGGFFVDGQVRLDYYQNALNDPIVSGIFNQKLDARGLSFAGNFGYHHQLPNNWFIEPSAGIIVSRVQVDPLNITGTLVLPSAGGISLPGTLRVDDMYSTLGRWSLRAGTSFVSNNIAWQPFGTASIYHEFQGRANASFTGYFPIPGFDIAGNVSTTSIGTYGQFGLGIAAQVLNTGWLGYLRADYRTGSNIEGYSLNGGLRYQFSPDQIAGAPMFTKAVKAPVMAGPYNWTGLYIGASAGVLNGRNDWSFPGLGTRTNPRYAGFAGGGQIGYDWQIGTWVVGLEGSLMGSNARGARSCPNALFYTCENEMNWLGTATAKLGYTIWNRSLVYLRGGAAFGNTRIVTNCNTGPDRGYIDYSIPAVIAQPGCGANSSKTAAGWTVGLGTEFALTRSWTVRAESNYFDLGTERYSLAQGGGIPPLQIDTHNNGFISTIGLNYRFPIEPVMAARY
ncbi:outer membrane autotransporter barrel protein [Nitrobacter sp. Nb-311A]|uniref:autotransporter domain-containing protein n=1 Tax=unclassified Nitrobacter TaxID=2620411 RepID=UPI00006865A5|nr:MULTISPECIES: autotransporter domain-containing protein [unclassified Nitrobacter]EAQ36013.1 outer membrane autotransporter barrel protein [Nitrobacter sp. Nb-311A]MCB1393346.1 autotransporter domain-containing protein [Nitrobacter sp.]MCV0385832.1 autotransporter domain-containing protein [Nitrobacter sp.]